jgi:sarcosine oxidase, subunit gamma
MADASWMRIKEPGARLLLQGDVLARTVAAEVWGVPFSEESCRARTAGNRATLWLGPDEHLLWQASRQPELPIAALEQALQSQPHALVDVSHRQIGVGVTGPHAATILAGACPLDLDLQRFPVGMCTRTVLAKAEIVLWRTAAEEFHLEIWRSFQNYTVELLQEIGREFSDSA